MQIPTSSTVWCAPVCEVAAGLDGEIEPAVAREQIEHVIEEPDAGVALAPRRLRRARGSTLDVGLAGLAVDLGGAGHRGHCRGCGLPSTARGARSPRRGRPGAAARASSAAVADPDLAEAAAEVPGRQRRGEPRRAVRRQHVVRAGDVVAERGARVRADEHAAGVGDRAAPGPRRRADELQVLGGERLGERERLFGVA